VLQYFLFYFFTVNLSAGRVLYLLRVKEDGDYLPG